MKRNASRSNAIEKSLNLGWRGEVLRRLSLRISQVRIEDGLDSFLYFKVIACHSNVLKFPFQELIEDVFVDDWHTVCRHADMRGRTYYDQRKNIEVLGQVDTKAFDVCHELLTVVL